MRRTATNNYLPRALLVLLAGAVLAAGLWALVGAKPAWGAERTFAPAPSSPFAVGTSPTTVTSADFNGDGKEDLAAANAGSDSVSVLFGNGDGTFQPKQDFAVGDGPNFVTSAHLNDDGEADFVDLVAANAGSDNVSILLGNGDGTFQEAQNLAVGDAPVSVTSARFNDDGGADFVDLVVANRNSDNVSVLLGNGDGTFEEAQNLAVGDTPESVTSGDFNDDEKTDIATANDPFSSSTPDSISVLFGNGDGTFQPIQNLTAGLNPEQVISADLDGDEKVDDLAVANWGTTFADLGSISVLLGNPDGTFQAAPDVETAPDGVHRPTSITAADFDEDGRTDLAAANSNPFGDPDDVSVLSGYGDGTFQAPQNFAVGIEPSFVISPDLNADGHADLAVAGSQLNSDATRTGYVSVLLNPSDFTPPKVTSNSPAQDSTGVEPSTNVTATFSEDMDSSSISNHNFTLLEQGSSGTLAAQVSYDSATKKATLDPVSDLKANTTYTATVNTFVKDLAGNALEQNFS